MAALSAVSRTTRAGLPVLLILASAAAQGQQPPEGPDAGAPSGLNEVDYFSNMEAELSQIGSSLTDLVVSSTKTEQRAAQAPVVITVITDAQIRERGYTSIAEALRTVPGLYDVNDLVSHNIGVRGVNGGARAGGSILRLMIDGMAVDYRPGTTNFFGEELIPIEVIDRIEVIRGPASALYGANAFLGVINVITKSGKQLPLAQVTARGTLIRANPGGGVEVEMAAQSDTFDLVLGAAIAYRDRSGLILPPTSSLFARPGVPLRYFEASQNDVSIPRTFFGKASVKIGPGRLSTLASIQNSDVAAEFQGFGLLTHKSRLTQLNQHYQLAYNFDPNEHLSFSVSGTYSNAAPTRAERLSLGRSDYELVRSVGAQGFGVAAEGKFIVSRHFTGTAGGDFFRDDHLLQTYDQRLLADVAAPDGTVIRAAGTLFPGEGHGKHLTFDNIGGYAQGLITWTPDWSTVLGTRLDYHNIYGLNWSNRVGVVYAPVDRTLSVKLLYGSSFKVPSADQLYTQPMTFLDIKGNPNLRTQTAHTFELAGGYGWEKRFEVTLNLFVTNVLGRVEFRQSSSFLLAQSVADEWVAGGEMTASYEPFKWLLLDCSASVARTVVRTSLLVVSDPRQVSNPMYPTFQFQLNANVLLPFAGLRLRAESAYVSSRAASQANANFRGEAYEYPGYFYTAAALALPPHKFFGEYLTSASLRVSDILDTRWTESDYAGQDVPGLGRTITLTLTQGL